jgi:hypothetical protein
VLVKETRHMTLSGHEVCIVSPYKVKTNVFTSSLWAWLAMVDEGTAAANEIARSPSFKAKDVFYLDDNNYSFEAKEALTTLTQALIRNGWEFVGDRALTGEFYKKVFRRRIPGGATSPDPRGPANSKPEISRMIASLSELRDAGVLTQEEYDQKKRELLSRL